MSLSCVRLETPWTIQSMKFPQTRNNGEVAFLLQRSSTQDPTRYPIIGMDFLPAELQGKPVNSQHYLAETVEEIQSMENLLLSVSVNNSHRN